MPAEQGYRPSLSAVVSIMLTCACSCAQSGCRHENVKGGTVSLFALNTDGPTHQLEKRIGDRQAEPRSLEFASVAARLLCKCVEEVWDKVWFNADSGVLHGNVYPPAVLSSANPHMSTGACKFNSIADQL